MFSVALKHSSVPSRNSRITRQDFVRFVDEAYALAVARRKESGFSRFRQTWKNNAKTRFLVGAGLLASSAAAVAS